MVQVLGQQGQYQPFDVLFKYNLEIKVDESFYTTPQSKKKKKARFRSLGRYKLI